MDTVQTANQIQEILWGKCFIDVLDGDGEEQSFILRSLTSKEQNLSNYIYKKELEKVLALGLFTEEQLTVSYCAYGVWTGAHDEEIDKLKASINKIQQQIKLAEFTTVRKKQLKKKIKKVREEIHEKEAHKLNLFSLSAENRAEEVKRRFIASLATETLDEEPYWKTTQDFMGDRDALLIMNLAVMYIRKNWLPDKKIRLIARNPEWRYKWKASKNGESLYGRPIAEWSEIQSLLVFWSQYYDSVYDAYESPPDFVIEDDDALDAWVVEQNKKASQQKMTAEKGARNHKRASTNKDHQEHFIMCKDDDAIKQVQESNPDSVRNRYRRETAQIDKVKDGGKRIKEWNLGERRHNTPTKIIRKGR